LQTKQTNPVSPRALAITGGRHQREDTIVGPVRIVLRQGEEAPAMLVHHAAGCAVRRNGNRRYRVAAVRVVGHDGIFCS
jgi:hypothetical protein